MAIFGALFGLIGRFAGKLLTASLGWASTLLFGRVSQSRQTILAAITFGSLAWVVVLIGVVVPSVGTVLLAFAPIPAGIDQTWIRLAMLVAAIVIPIVIGIGTLFLRDRTDRPHGLAVVREILRGYPLAVALALTIAFLAVVAVVRKVRALATRRSDAHVAVVVKPGEYEGVVDDIESALDAAGLGVERHPAPAVLAMPARFVAKIAGRGVGSLVPDRLLVLRGGKLDVTIHPSDIALLAPKAEMARARAAIASRLTTSGAWLTTSEDGQALEDRLRTVARQEPHGDALTRALRPIDEELARTAIEYEEWEVLYRMRLQVERDLLRGKAPGQPVTAAASESAPGAAGTADAPPRPSGFERLAGALGLAMIAADLVIAVLDRRRPGG